MGVEQSWEVKLVLRREEVPLAWLGNSVWIGWSSWLGARLTDQDAADYSNTQGRHLPHWELHSPEKEPAGEDAARAEPDRQPQLVQ